MSVPLTIFNHKILKEHKSFFEIESKESINLESGVTLFREQREAALQLAIRANELRFSSVLLRAKAGLGKTFAIGETLRYFQDNNLIESLLLSRVDGSIASAWKSCKHYDFMVVTPIIEQTRRVIEDVFKVKNVLVTSYAQLRSGFGFKHFIDERRYTKNGEEKVEYIWRELCKPLVVVWDECQAVRLESSLQTEVVGSYNAAKLLPTFQLWSSATPGLRVSELKTICLSLNLDVTKYFRPKNSVERIVLDESNWKTFSENVSAPSKPDEYIEANLERLVDVIKPYIVEIHGVRTQFSAINRVETIKFKTEEEKNFYDNAWKSFEDRMRRSKNLDNAALANMEIRAAQMQFKRAAEVCKKRILAERMYNNWRTGKAPACGLQFKSSIAALVSILYFDYGISRDNISIIWGGMAKTSDLSESAMMDILKRIASGDPSITRKEINSLNYALQNKIDQVGELPSELRLGSQNKKARQEEIDNFQSGKTEFCIFSYKSGGVGLSLHHSDEWTKAKVRRKKESNYACEDDIPLIPIRSRSGDFGPTWSAIEMIQVLGRLPRLTSLSDTVQSLLCYEGTIEIAVKYVMSERLRCAGTLTSSKEDWTDMIVERYLKTPEKYRSAEGLVEEISSNEVLEFDEIDNENDKDS